MKLVIDANILVSAYTADGKIRACWRRTSREHDPIISPEIFAEVERTIRKREFLLSDFAARSALLDILKTCKVIRTRGQYLGSVPDEGDRHIVCLASQTGADAIITGDHALQKAKQFAGTVILSFADFVGEYCTSGRTVLNGAAVSR